MDDKHNVGKPYCELRNNVIPDIDPLVLIAVVVFGVGGIYVALYAWFDR